MQSHSDLAKLLESARTSRAAGRLDEAAQQLRRALELRPQSSELHNDLGATLMQARRFDEAIAALQTAIRLGPSQAPQHRNLGAILLGMGRYPEAAAVLSQLVRLEPRSAIAHLQLGTALARSGAPQKAVEHLRRATELDPNLGAAWCNLGLALEDSQQPQEAAAALAQARRLLPGSSIVAYHAGALGVGPPPAACPTEYLVELFDDYAARFDQHLFDRLEYRGPQLLFEAVSALPHPPKMDIIDLGCGTGVAGDLFRPIASRTVGVDLAPRMLEKSRQRGSYDELICQDVVAALQSRPASFDLALAADVFIYIGELRPLFQAAAKSLRQGGLFAFTIETTEGPSDYVLLPTRRYAQSLDYIRRLARETNFQEASFSPATIRAGEGPPVNGAVFVLRLSQPS